MVAITRGTDRKIPTRRVSFEERVQTLPRYFAKDDDLIMSHVIVSLSSVFPDGEDFFVRSVRNFRDQITDPELKREVAGFIGQEAIHGREHRELNQRFDDLGYAAKKIERFTKRGLEFRERVAPPISNLASTAALEHFTATLAEILLTDERAREELGREELTQVFLWHALEEAEHKAVAFDVYRAVGGTERMRIWTMRFTRYAFVLGMTFQVMVSLAGDRNTYRPGKLRKSLKRLRRSPFLRREVWEQLKAYERRGFHPNDIDTDALVVEWRERLFGSEGDLAELLA